MPLLPSVFTVMVPATVCPPPLCVSVWTHACKRVMAHMHTVALFARRFCSLHPLPAQTAPNYRFSCSLCVSPEGSLWVCPCMCVCVCVCVKHRGASGLCLLDIGGPCAPTKLRDKDCCLYGHKSGLSLAFTLSLLSVLPLFLTLPMPAAEWSQGASWGQSRHIPMPLALGTHSDSTWLLGSALPG